MTDPVEKKSLSPEDRMRRRRRLIVGAVLILVLSFGTFSNYGVLTRLKLDRHRSQIVDSLATLQHIRDSLTQRSEQLRRDTTEIERLAREKYGMSKTGEQVYIIRGEKDK